MDRQARATTVAPALTLPRPLAVPDAELFPGWLTGQAVKRSR